MRYVSGRMSYVLYYLKLLLIAAFLIALYWSKRI